MPTSTKTPAQPKKRRSQTRSLWQLQNENFAGAVAQLWRSMNPLQRAAFAPLGPFVPDWDGKRAARPLSAYQTFQSICRARHAVSLPITTEAPQSADLPPVLPKLTLSVTITPLGSAILLTPQTPYPYPCQIWAAPPQLPITQTVLPS